MNQVRLTGVLERCSEIRDPGGHAFRRGILRFDSRAAIPVLAVGEHNAALLPFEGQTAALVEVIGKLAVFGKSGVAVLVETVARYRG